MSQQTLNWCLLGQEQRLIDFSSDSFQCTWKPLHTPGADIFILLNLINSLYFLDMYCYQLCLAISRIRTSDLTAMILYRNHRYGQQLNYFYLEVDLEHVLKKLFLMFEYKRPLEYSGCVCIYVYVYTCIHTHMFILDQQRLFSLISICRFTTETF